MCTNLWLQVMIACICKGITESEVCRAGRAGIVSPEALVGKFALDDVDCCGQCMARIDDFVELAQQGAMTELFVLPVARGRGVAVAGRR
ncbi:MAG TPA: hypothetical protein VGE94_07110 [Chloroflexota bacterium]